MTNPTTDHAATDHTATDQQPPAKLSAALDLDALEREGGTPQPFDFILGGHRFLLSDPQEVDWQDMLVALRDPTMFFRLTLPAEDHGTFFRSRLPSWKLNALMGKYLDHYGLPVPLDASGLPR